MVLNKEETQFESTRVAKIQPCHESGVKSKTYYGGEVISCIASLLNNTKRINTESNEAELINFEFIGADVKLRKSSLSKESNRSSSATIGIDKKCNVSFVETVVIKEYPSFDFLLNETEFSDIQAQNFLQNFSEYEKTLFRKLDKDKHVEEISLSPGVELSKESLNVNIKAANTVNKMIDRYKEMIESRAVINLGKDHGKLKLLMENK